MLYAFTGGATPLDVRSVASRTGAIGFAAGLLMGRCVFPRRGLGWVAPLFVAAVLSLPAFVGAPTGSYATAGVNTTDVQAASTLDLTGLQSHFSAVADRVSPCVVAISASTTPIDTDEALRTESLNPSRLDSILSKTTRTVGTGFFIDSDGYILTN